MRRIGHFIGGKHQAGSGRRYGPVMNPAVGEQTAEVALASAGEVASAIAAA